MSTFDRCDLEERFEGFYDSTSKLVDISDRDLLGLGGGLQLRRHIAEAVANDAMHEARTDWRRYIGPIDTFADANPYDGNFVALVLPFTSPNRIKVSAYFMECKAESSQPSPWSSLTKSRRIPVRRYLRICEQRTGGAYLAYPLVNRRRLTYYV